VEGEERSIAAAVRRMALSQVGRVASVAEAGQVCAAGQADVCIVVLRNPVFAEVPFHGVESDAPGRGSVPALLLADVVTPYVRQTARRSGYAAVLPFTAPRPLLYRAVRGLLQKARRPERIDIDRFSPARGQRRPRVAARVARPFDPLRRKPS
jgi:hypothetical protein